MTVGGGSARGNGGSAAGIIRVVSLGFAELCHRAFDMRPTSSRGMSCASWRRAHIHTFACLWCSRLYAYIYEFDFVSAYVCVSE